ncbi:MAG: sigma 54-interacting transcriptional regulator [Acidobacteriota bacterium]
MYQPLFARSLSSSEKEALLECTASRVREESQRAEVILLSSQGKTIGEISDFLGFHPTNIKKWIRNFNENGVEGIAVKKRGPQGGPRPSFTRQQVKEIIKLAKSTPATFGLNYKEWTPQKLADFAVSKGIVERISHVTVRQLLKKELLTEQQEKSPNEKDSVSQNHSNTAVASHFQYGIASLKNSEYEKAVAHFQVALEEGIIELEDEANIRCLLSQALEELSRYEEAHTAIRKFEDPKLLTHLSPQNRARVRLRIGWAESWLGNYPEAIAAFNEAKKIFLDLQIDAGVSEAHYAIGRTYIEINELRIARDHLLTAISFQRKLIDKELLARIYSRLGTIDFAEGSFASMKENLLKALGYVDGSTNHNLIGMIYLNLGAAFLDDYVIEQDKVAKEKKRAVEYLELAVSYLEKGGHKDYLALAYNNLGDNLRASGFWDKATTSLRKAIEVAQTYAKPNYEATARLTLSELLCDKGEFDEAEEHLRKGLSLIGKDENKWLESNALRLLANVQKGKGQIDAGLHLLNDSLQLSTSIGDLHGVALSQIALAECYFLQKNFDQSREYLELAQGRLKEEKSLYMSGLVQRLIGQLESEAQRFAEAKQHIAQSISVFTTTDVPYELARSHYEMGRLLKRSNDIKGAQGHWVQAKEIFERLGAKPDIIATNKKLAAVTKTAVDEPKIFHTILPNDVLLMQRLIEASASSELLVRELAAIIYDNFPVTGVIVSKFVDNLDVEPLSFQGVTRGELDALLSAFDPRGIEKGERVNDWQVFKICDDLKSPVLLFIRAVTVLESGRLMPLLKQAELGLETCSLRVAARGGVTIDVEQRVKTVMPGFIVGSAPMFDVIDKIQKIRTSNVTVLITGESGTGKELVARYIHAESARARAIFLPFNCTATPKEIIDSQLFGHRRGAFTGATDNYPGIIRAADSGTLFLDEIGDLSLEVQPKLMRFLQESEIQPLGETRPIRVDVRVLAATNTELERAVDDGRFRADLFHRLNIIRIHVPPLRERREEVPILASHFLEHFASRSGKPGIRLTQDAIDALTAYDWPGNVRQLRNEVERSVAYAYEGSMISVDDLSAEVSSPKRHQFRGQTPKSEELNLSVNIPKKEERREPVEPNSNGFDWSPGGTLKLKEVTAKLEKKIIQTALDKNKNNLSKTALDLGLSRRGLRLKLVQLGISKDEN